MYIYIYTHTYLNIYIYARHSAALARVIRAIVFSASFSAAVYIYIFINNYTSIYIHINIYTYHSAALASVIRAIVFSASFSAIVPPSAADIHTYRYISIYLDISLSIYKI